MVKKKILVSACLVGLRCRYDGKKTKKIRTRENFIPVCPEQLGGLPTPRPCANLAGGKGNDVLVGRARVIDRKGKDVTKNFVRGARESGKLAKLYHINEAYLKRRSPSCGKDGVTTAYLKKRGIKPQFF